MIVGVPYRRDDADRLKHGGPDQRHRRGRRRRRGARRGGRCGGGRPGPGLSRWYRDAARRPVEARLRLPSQGRPKRGGFLFRGRIGGTPVPARRGGAVRRPNRRPIVALAAALAHKGQAELVGIHVVEIDWTLPLDADVAGRSEDAQRVLDIAEATAEAGHCKLETVLLQARDVGAAHRRRGDRARRRPARRRAPRSARGSAATSPSGGRSRTS